VTVKDIMVADYPWHIPYMHYGKSVEDVTARALAVANRTDSLTWGKANFQAMIRQFVNVTYTPIAILPSQFGDFPANTPIQGIPYSSARGNDRMVGMHISLHTFLSAIHNPRSVLYTRRITHNNAKTFYGCVCSAFINYVYGESINLTTDELKDWDELTPESFMALEIGDMLWIEGHVKIVYDVTRDEYGRIISITVAEAGEPVVKWTCYTWDSFLNASSNYVAYRYKHIDGVKYTYEPAVMGFLDETPTEVVYPDIMCEYGDKVAILEGEDIAINVIDSTGYSQIQVYINNELARTITSLADFTIENAVPGNYEIRMIGGNKESVTKFIVVQASCNYDPDSHILTFSSANAVPYCVLTYTSYPTNHYVALTDEQLASGQVDLTNDIGFYDKYNCLFQYVKVNFKTEYGTATWYSHDLHQWEYIS